MSELIRVWPDRAEAETDDDLASWYRMPDPPAGSYLRTNFVATIDGSTQGADGRSGTINTPVDQWLFAVQRALADVVLVGAGTARAEGYRAVELTERQLALRVAAGLSDRPPVLVVVSRSLRLDPLLRSAAGGPVIVLCGVAGNTEPLESAGVEILRSPGPGGVDLRRAIGILADRGLGRILCEGGPTLHSRLLDEGLVDEICLTTTARVGGGLGRRVADGPEVVTEFDLAHLLVAADHTVFARWVRRR